MIPDPNQNPFMNNITLVFGFWIGTIKQTWCGFLTLFCPIDYVVNSFIQVEYELIEAELSVQRRICVLKWKTRF